MTLDHVTIVLVRPQQPGNIGLAARAMAHHGIHHLSLVQPMGFDPDRARWMAPNAQHIIDNAHFCGSIGQAVHSASRVIATTARPRRWDRPVWTSSEVAAAVVGEPEQTAIVFGPEDSGLSTDDLALCHGILSLPTVEARSLNLAQAVTVICSMLRTEVGPPLPGQPEEPTEPSPTWLQDAVVSEAVEVLDRAGYLNGRNPTQVHGTLYRLLARAAPSHLEAATLRGMAAQLMWWFKDRSGP